MTDRLGSALEKRRVAAVLPLVRGRLLDIGCGRNALVRAHGDGVGVDVHDRGGADLLVSDSSRLPFPDGAFDTVSIVAALNHIPNRGDVLKECRRLLSPGGRLIVTMLSPWVSPVWHVLRSPWDADQRERGMKKGEVYGLSRRQVLALTAPHGFVLRSRRRFMAGLNALYLFTKNP